MKTLRQARQLGNKQRSLFKPELRVGKFSSVENEASVGSWNVRINPFNWETSVRNVETGALQLLKSILVFVRHVRFKVMDLHTPLPECCLHCVCEFGATREPILGNRGEQIRCLRRKWFHPKPTQHSSIFLGSVRCYTPFLRSLTESMSSLCWSRHWSPPPFTPTGFPSRLELQLFSLEDDKCLSHVHTCSASSPHQPDASKETGTETRRWHRNENVSFRIFYQEPLRLPPDETIWKERITMGPDSGPALRTVFICIKGHEIRFAIKSWYLCESKNAGNLGVLSVISM